MVYPKDLCWDHISIADFFLVIDDVDFANYADDNTVMTILKML